MLVDLHIHTTASDGVYLPNEIMNMAVKAGLSYIAITDHDTVDGVRSLPGTFNGLTVIPGIEFSTDLPDNEVHILGYYIDINHPALLNEIEQLTNHRFVRVKRIVEKLICCGFKVTYEEVLALAGSSKSVGRSHVANLLVRKGFFASETDAFDKLLGKNRPAYEPHYSIDPYKAIQLIDNAGGIPVLAHPGLVGSKTLVLELVRAGIRGIEVYHPAHSLEQIKEYTQLAHENKLMVTGGSDFHGTPNRFPSELGIFTVDSSVIKFLKQSLS